MPTMLEMIAAAKKQKVADVRTYFVDKWLKNSNGTAKCTLGSVDRSAIRAFLMEPPTPTMNPGGSDPDGLNVWEALLEDTKLELDAAEVDDARLLTNLLLIYKVVRRG